MPDLKFDSLNSEQLNVIYNLTFILNNANDEEDVLKKILSELIRETGAEIGAFVYFDSKENTFIPKTVESSLLKSTSSVQFSQTIFRKVLESKEAVLSYDVQKDSSYENTESLHISDIHAVLAFPLIVENRIYGILYFDSRKNRQGFNETSRQLLSFFAPIASLTLEQILKKRKAENENILLRTKLDSTQPVPRMIGESDPMKNLFQIIRKVSKYDVPVIINGENGTGKDLVARAIYELSPRNKSPFIAQYIGNIPSTIVESELFGYKKGAFTGANSDKAGLFEAVNGGTLFLDEIGDLTPELQTKFLRVLQNKEIKRLGENTVRNVNVRIITATNKNLQVLVKEEKFREDLYYRLNVINLEVPPLRERISDIPLLVNHFLESSPDFKISRAALKKLIGYNWPGNVRQLENIISRAAILANRNVIDEEDIQFDEKESPFFGTIEEFNNQLIVKRLKQFNGNKSQTARSLGISLRSLQMRIKKIEM
jgi:Nif-specific regulatory protein